MYSTYFGLSTTEALELDQGHQTKSTHCRVKYIATIKSSHRVLLWETSKECRFTSNSTVQACLSESLLAKKSKWWVSHAHAHVVDTICADPESFFQRGSNFFTFLVD